MRAELDRVERQILRMSIALLGTYEGQPGLLDRVRELQRAVNELEAAEARSRSTLDAIATRLAALEARGAAVEPVPTPEPTTTATSPSSAGLMVAPLDWLARHSRSAAVAVAVVLILFAALVRACPGGFDLRVAPATPTAKEEALQRAAEDAGVVVE